MWETPFEPSMLGKSGVAIHCPDGVFAQDLMEILEKHGVKWRTGESPVTFGDCWGVEKENTIYYIEARKSMTYGNKARFRDRNYTKCTFFGPESTDFDTATDDELRSLFGM